MARPPTLWPVTTVQPPVPLPAVDPAAPVTVPPQQAGSVGGHRWRAMAVVGTHFVIDAFSFVIISLLPVLVLRLDIRPEQKALLLGLGSVSSGLIQPVVAWFSDRFDTRLLGSAGFVLAVLAITNVVEVSTFGQLAAVFAIGAMGVGAFHPPAAAAVGRLSGARRARFLAIFFLAGMLGGMTGNLFTPWFVGRVASAGGGEVDLTRGLGALRWFIPLGLASVAVLTVAIRRVGHHGHASHHAHASWDAPERRARWRAVWLLYVSNMMRFSVNMALVYLFVSWAERHALHAAGAAEMTKAISTEAATLNGQLQAAMQFGMGAGGIVLGFVVSARYEKMVYWLIPTVGAVAVACVGLVDHASPRTAAALAILGSVLSGAGFGGCIPLSLGLAQRMLPHRTSLASGLMLGGAWAFAFVGPLLAELVQNGLRAKASAPAWLLHAAESLPDSVGRPLLEGMGLDAGFYFTGGALFLAGLVTLGLPRDLMLRTHKD